MKRPHSWILYVMVALTGVGLSGCKHRDSSRTDPQKELQANEQPKPSFTPRYQKDVKEVITLMKLPF